MKNNFKCTCGHYQNDHTIPMFDKYELGCGIILKESLFMSTFCECEAFKLDNVSYLEKKYYERS